jgi:uncharacterized membrane protein YwaF
MIAISLTHQHHRATEITHTLQIVITFLTWCCCRVTIILANRRLGLVYEYIRTTSSELVHILNTSGRLAVIYANSTIIPIKQLKIHE